jgi:transcriptional regulator with PAS, ATPase and Fis domain
MVTGRPIFNEDGSIKLIVINARDITEIYDLTEELQKARQAEKMYMDHLSDLSSLAKKEFPILAVSKAMNDTLQLAEKVAGFQTTVLIMGESGVGKEEVAKYIHHRSMRKEGPFIAVNCGAIPDNLLESEMFGYERGAFTGALQSGKEGLIEAAEGGTIFLDEIGETSLDFQVKLLRFLEKKEIRRIGNVSSKTIDVRVVAATNRDLKQLIEEGKFREDLYYRINVVQITVPALKQRRDDIMPLAALFLQMANQKYGQEKLFTYEVVQELESREWLGNVRELKNVVENMVIVSNNEYLQVEDLPWYKDRLDGENEKGDEVFLLGEDISLADALDDYEKKLLLKMKGRCSTTRDMADKLKVNQSTIVRKLKKHNIVLG